jgi:hypothetical protein
MVILRDFDDTTAQQNGAIPLLDRYQPIPGDTNPYLRELHKQFLVSDITLTDITLTEYPEIAFWCLGSTGGGQMAYDKQEARLHDGFMELAEYCRYQDIEPTVVSHGPGFYVQAPLEQAGLEHIPLTQSRPRSGAAIPSSTTTSPGLIAPRLLATASDTSLRNTKKGAGKSCLQAMAPQILVRPEKLISFSRRMAC